MNPEVSKKAIKESYEFASKFNVSPHFAFKLLKTHLRKQVEILASWVARPDKDFMLSNAVQVFEVEFGEKLSWSQVRKILRHFSPEFAAYDDAERVRKKDIRDAKRVEKGELEKTQVSLSARLVAADAALDLDSSTSDEF